MLRLCVGDYRFHPCLNFNYCLSSKCKCSLHEFLGSHNLIELENSVMNKILLRRASSFLFIILLYFSWCGCVGGGHGVGSVVIAFARFRNWTCLAQPYL